MTISIADPVALGVPRSRISKWRALLFQKLGPYCYVCEHLHGRKRRADHLHEGFITRGDCQGFPFPGRLRCFSDVNSFPICATCHKSPPSRMWFFEKACENYGEDAVREWYASFGWKVPRKDFMP